MIKRVFHQTFLLWILATITKTKTNCSLSGNKDKEQLNGHETPSSSFFSPKARSDMDSNCSGESDVADNIDTTGSQ